jgi:glycogen debranching enzyme
MIDPTNQPSVPDEDHHIAGSSAHETDGGRVLKQGDAFVIVDRLGNIQTTGRGEQGLFYRGTRYISRLRFRFGKRAPMLLCSSVLENNLLLAVDLANPDMQDENGRIAHGTVHVARRALLEDGAYLERIVVHNYGSAPVHFPLRLELGADFADIFEVRGAHRPRRGALLPPRVDGSSLHLAYEGLDLRTRSTVFSFSEDPTSITPEEVVFDLKLSPHAEFSFDMVVRCGLGPATDRAALEYDAVRLLQCTRRSDSRRSS